MGVPFIPIGPAGSGGGSCDYPTVSDVRLGVSYAAGALVGTLEVSGGSGSINLSPGTIQRSTIDQKPITFAWPAFGATISAEVSVDNGLYQPVAGTVAFLRTDGGKYWYTLSYNAADRPDGEGTARYRFVDGDGNGPLYAVLNVMSGESPLLNQIASKTALLSAGRRPQIVSNVAAAGRLDLYVGDDYVGDDALSLPIEDVGGVVHDRLTAAGVDSVVIGASLDRRATNLISGTITDISYASDETTLTIEIAHSDISTEAPLSDDYQYQIARVMTATGSDEEPLQIIEITGSLTLSRRHVARVTE